MNPSLGYSLAGFSVDAELVASLGSLGVSSSDGADFDVVLLCVKGRGFNFDIQFETDFDGEFAPAVANDD
jgi:hypothetical protein